MEQMHQDGLEVIGPADEMPRDRRDICNLVLERLKSAIIDAYHSGEGRYQSLYGHLENDISELRHLLAIVDSEEFTEIIDTFNASNGHEVADFVQRISESTILSNEAILRFRIALGLQHDAEGDDSLSDYDGSGGIDGEVGG